MRSTLIDAAELAALSVGPGTGAGSGVRLDAPILAAAIDLGDADLELDLQCVLRPTDLLDVGFVAAAAKGGGCLLRPRQVAGAPFTA